MSVKMSSRRDRQQVMLCAASQPARRTTSTVAIMRIIRFLAEDGETYWANEPAPGTDPAVLCKEMYPGEVPDLASLEAGPTMAIKQLLSPIAPTNCFCIGLNYAAHAAEGARKRGVELVLPKFPVTFMKATSALLHPGQDIVIPSIDLGEQTDYECELAVVIGKPCKDATEDNALDFVLGYTCANDVSARHWQRNAGGDQWIIGKTFDTFLPLGPVLVTADEIPDPQVLQISTKLNGQIMQDSNTSDMIFDVRTIIAWLSKDTTLLPGTPGCQLNSQPNCRLVTNQCVDLANFFRFW